jgi:hypothetical protein
LRFGPLSHIHPYDFPQAGFTNLAAGRNGLRARLSESISGTGGASIASRLGQARSIREFRPKHFGSATSIQTTGFI